MVKANPTAQAALAGGPPRSPVIAAGGFRTFSVIWLGQVVSTLGSGLTAFALGIWVFQTTGSVTRFTLVAIFTFLPSIVLSPVAGVLVDRFDRRLMMIVSDTGAALATALLVILLLGDWLRLWQVYLLVAVSSAFNTLQFPAFTAATSLLVPKQHLGRAGGMQQFGMSGAQILAPLTAGFLMAWIGLTGIIAIDFGTFLFSILLLQLVRVPRPAASVAGTAGAGSFWHQVGFGWTYIVRRPALLSLLTFFAVLNLVLPFAVFLTTPLVLSFATPDELGIALATGATGSLVGGLVMSAWGGPPRKIHGILAISPLVALGMFVAAFRPSVPLVACGLFAVFFAVPILNGCSQAIWQSKVEPDVQGRVFAMRQVVAQLTAPITLLLAGPLAEKLFEPLLLPGGALASSVGAILGTGPGRGIAFFFIVMGSLFLINILWALANRRLRRIEVELPDVVPAEPPSVD